MQNSAQALAGTFMAAFSVSEEQRQAHYGSALGQGVGFPRGSAVNNSPANGGNFSLIPASGRSPEEGNLHFSIFAWEIPWTEEPGRLQSMRSVKESAATEQLHNNNNSGRGGRRCLWFPLTTLKPIGTATWSRGAIHLCLCGLGGPQSR